MKSVFVAFALLVARVAAQSLQINTPANVVVCEPVQFTWSGGTPPYFLSILPGDSPSSPALEDLGTQTGTSFTWLANIAAGTSIGLTLRDSTGTTAQSAPFTINSGTNTSCVGQTTSAGSSTSTGTGTSSGSASTSASGTTTTPATTTTKAATTTTSKGTTTTSPGGSTTGTGTTAATATSSSNAGPTQGASLGVAGIVGAAVLALLA